MPCTEAFFSILLRGGWDFFQDIIPQLLKPRSQVNDSTGGVLEGELSES